MQQALREANKYDLTIIDGPARTSHETLEIAQVADLVIQPAGASRDDLEPAIREFHALVKAGVNKKKLLLVLTRLSTDKEAQTSELPTTYRSGASQFSTASYETAP